ncbi:MAG: hypothetical protein E7645_00525 [Ruminococcaceae bacterium]|nr:hypothetical protein [Oscillospiraceae bacterium]
MYTDIHGNQRLKLGLHTHTTLSDGHKTPEEALSIYASMGYDAVAITDHWIFSTASEGRDGCKQLAGCEYNIGGSDGTSGVYHIVGLCMTRDPEISRNEMDDSSISVALRGRKIIEAIRAAGGFAVLAHPAWSLNTPTQILDVAPFDALEIYNSVSDFGMSDRPDSGLLVDMAAGMGCCPPLLATDDTHYYTGDEGRGFIMLEAEAAQSMGIPEAIRAGKFYASQGPEIHLERVDERTLRLTCTPAQKIVFLSNVVWARGRVHRGAGLTEATYTLHPDDTFVRAEVTDSEGLRAWSGIVKIK